MFCYWYGWMLLLVCCADSASESVDSLWAETWNDLVIGMYV